jgi:hypothetical protein
LGVISLIPQVEIYPEQGSVARVMPACGVDLPGGEVALKEKGALVGDLSNGGGRWRRSDRVGRLALAVVACVVGVLLSAGLASGTQPYDTYQTTIAADGPVAQYRFDDALGSSTLADSAGSYTATNSGITLGGEGPFGGSKSGAFASEAYALLASDPLEGASEFTAEAWVDWNGGSSYKQPIFDFGSSSTNYMYLTPASELSGHKMLFEIRTSEGTVFQVTAPELEAKTWDYVAVTESSSGTLTLYLNGEQVGQTTGATISPASLGSAPDDYLGKSQVYGDPLFEGSLSNVAFYDKALSGSRILAHYDAGEFPVDTSLPTISGTTRDGETLTAKAESWTGLAPITFAYQWTRCNSAGGECAYIGSATEAKYKLSHEDVGRTLRVAVGATNSAGEGGATSAQTPTIEALKPSNTSAPTVSGSAEEGQTLTASTGSWEGTPTISYAYQWQDCDSLGEDCMDISGATASSYTLQAGDVGSMVRVVVTASNAGGSASASSEASAVVTSNSLIYTSQFGSEGSGDGQFNHPGDVAIGPGGDLFVLDQGNDRVEVFNESGEYLRQFGSAGSGNGQMSEPDGLAVNSEGDVWILDTGNGRIEEFNEDGDFIQIAGTGLIGSAEGIAVDRHGDVWVSATYEGHLLVFSGEGEYLKTVGSKGSGPGQLDEPEGLTVDGNGHVWVAEWSNNRVQEFNEAGEYLSNFGSAGSGAGEISNPYGITAGDGHVFVGEAGNNRVQEFDEAGDFVAQLGTRGSEPGQLELSYPVGLAINSAGDVWVTDFGNNRVEEWAPEVPVAPSNVTSPGITGELYTGKTLSTSTGTWKGDPRPSYSYQWQKCNASGAECANISGATSQSYTLTEGDAGSTVRVVVTAENSEGSASATSASTAVITVATTPSNTTLPAISGTAQDGRTLSASTGSWEGTLPISYAYQWQSCNLAGEECQDVEGATEQTYTATSGDLETRLRVVVTASNVAGSAQATSAASAEVEPGTPSEFEPPLISGDPDEGETLYGEAGRWGGTENEVGYQWERCNSTGGECSDIAGATEADYRPAGSDVGDTLRLRVGVSNALGAVTAISPATEAISAISKLMNTWAPSIAGTPQSEQTLSADAGSWLGVTSIGYEYQWQKCNMYGASCEDIAGATYASYTLSSEDVGSTIRVRVHASEEEGGAYETSAATQPVAANTGPVVEAPPTVSGTGLVGDGITAATGSWSEEPVSYGYQWERCDEYGESCSSISGATSSTDTLTESDTTHTVRVLVTATGGGSSTEAASFPLSVSATALVNVATPSISGAYEYGRTLSADHGIWTGAGAFSYTYQWERCNEHGEACSTITGATESSYTPGESDVGKTMKVKVTATGTAGTESMTSAATPEILLKPIAPEDLFAPSIEGNLTVGETLTAQPGSWLSTESISYGYQWQICSEEGEECTNISEATSGTYTLSEEDIDSTLRVVVTASNTLGSASVISHQSEVVGASGPPAASGEGPAVHGPTQVGQTVVAETGQWSGSRPLTYTYQWERCNPAGEECATIEHATNGGYTITSEDATHTLRVAVTATNTLGTATARSAATAVSAAGEASTTPALELAEEIDPSVLAPSEAATLEGQAVKPQIANSEELIATSSALTSSTISKETPGEFTVNTSAGELSFAPLESSPSATTTPTIVNGATALYAETEKATDTFVRPTPLGATTLLQLRSAQAPTSFSWEVGLGADQELEQLSDGNVAVIEPSSGPELESELPTESMESPESESAEKPAEEGQSSEGAETELESGLSEEGPLEKLSAAPETTTPEVTPRSGELHPQDTKAQYERAANSMSSAETETDDTTIMVIQAPQVIDAEGDSVPATLSVEGNTVTMAITPSDTTKWPATAELSLGAPTDQASAAKAHGAQFGLSDENASAFNRSEKEGKVEDEIDPKLKSGPLHVKRARMVLNWNTSPTNKRLLEWLKAVKEANLTPFITLRKCEPVPASYSSTKDIPCPAKQPSLKKYRTSVRRLMKTLIHGNSNRPSVRLWGTWNEPEFAESPWNNDPKGAKVGAYLWGETKLASEEAGCHHHCTVVAGEFSQYEPHHLYDMHYEEDILQAERKHHFPTQAKPHVWGMHDYDDLENVQVEKRDGKEVLGNYQNNEAQGFVRHTQKLYHDAHIWMSEQGVELEEKEGPRRLKQQPGLQKFAAKDFLRFRNASEHVEWAYYYEYRGPKSAREFDSALLSGNGKEPEDWRPAYCVLVLGLEGCPPKVKTKAPVSSSITSEAGTISLSVDPLNSATTYFVEYGTTEAYGKTTTVTVLPNENGEQSETVALSGLEPCTTYHYQAEAENEASEGTPSLGGDQTFTTGKPGECTSGRLTYTFTKKNNGYLASNPFHSFFELGFIQPLANYVAEEGSEDDWANPWTTEEITMSPPLTEEQREDGSFTFRVISAPRSYEGTYKGERRKVDGKSFPTVYVKAPEEDNHEYGAEIYTIEWKCLL